MKRAFFAFLAMSLAACPPPSGQLPTGPDPNSGGGGGGDPGGGGAAPTGAGGLGSAACPLTTIGPSPGLEGCYDCMLEKCCAEVQACDGDPDCVYCTSAEGQIDSSERCVDPSTFSVYPNRRGRRLPGQPVRVAVRRGGRRQLHAAELHPVVPELRLRLSLSHRVSR
ncbi:MAG: hypothetical protein IPH80_33460 [Myxococcales bacterium]|nr:hypothetical protein [Myxococcales bacterium]